MSERAPIQHIETEPPLKSLEATIIDFPATPDESKRYEDIEFAHTTAIQQDIKRDMIKEAKADVDRAYAQKSPLTEKYEQKYAFAKMELAQDELRADNFYDRHYRKPSQSAQDEHRLAA